MSRKGNGKEQKPIDNIFKNVIFTFPAKITLRRAKYERSYQNDLARTKSLVHKGKRSPIYSETDKINVFIT